MSTHEVVLPLFSSASQLDGNPMNRKYRTIVADPPWRIEMGPTLTKKHVKAALEYPTMTQQELLQLPVGLWAQEKAHLYLWTTNAMLGDALSLAKAWGFKFSTLITWLKRRDERDRWQGLGRYYRVTTEHIVFAVRSGLDVLNKDQPNILETMGIDNDGLAFYAARGGHSEKPAAFYDMVERMSPGPYLDVFARKQRFNWDTFGDESYDFREHGLWHKEPTE